MIFCRYLLITWEVRKQYVNVDGSHSSTRDITLGVPPGSSIFSCIRKWPPLGTTEHRSRHIECFHSHGQHLCKFIGTKESVCVRKEFNSQRSGLGQQHGRRFIVLGHQYDRRDVMWKHSICRWSYDALFHWLQISTSGYQWWSPIRFG